MDHILTFFFFLPNLASMRTTYVIWIGGASLPCWCKCQSFLNPHDNSQTLSHLHDYNTLDKIFISLVFFFFLLMNEHNFHAWTNHHLLTFNSHHFHVIFIILYKWTSPLPNNQKKKNSPSKLPIIGILHQLRLHPHHSLRGLSLCTNPLSLSLSLSLSLIYIYIYIYIFFFF